MKNTNDDYVRKVGSKTKKVVKKLEEMAKIPYTKRQLDNTNKKSAKIENVVVSQTNEKKKRKKMKNELPNMRVFYHFGGGNSNNLSLVRNTIHAGSISTPNNPGIVLLAASNVTGV